VVEPGSASGVLILVGRLAADCRGVWQAGMAVVMGSGGQGRRLNFLHPASLPLVRAFGLGKVDPAGRGEEWGLLVGLRSRTGERFLIGLHLDLQWAPD
jgi:hypothetical protein